MTYRRVERQCPHCGTTFWVSRSKAARGQGRFCSMSCLTSFREAQHITRQCETCGNGFTFRRWELRGHAKRFCSKRCEGLARRAEQAGSFWSYVDRSDGPAACWVWQGRRTSHGYGRFSNPGEIEEAHRLAWQFTHGPIPSGLNVLHTCDNPPCCNPAHLWLGTHADNMRDMWQKDRHNAPVGEDHPQSKISNAAVAEIRARHRAGERQNALAAEFGVSGALVSQIVRGKARKRDH